MVATVIAGLYFARAVLIPFALASMLAFLLTPLVVRLRRWNFGRVPSVLCVMLFTLALIATLGGLVWLQLSDFSHELPKYQQNIENKVRSIRESSSVTIGRLTRLVRV